MTTNTAHNVELEKLTPPKEISSEVRKAAFEYFKRKIASHRHSAARFADEERRVVLNDEDRSQTFGSSSTKELDVWANNLLQHAWVACGEPGKECPIIDELSDTSTRGLPPLPSGAHMHKLANTILFLHITTSKQYSAHSRAFLFSLPDDAHPDEPLIAETLKHPQAALSKATEAAEASKAEQASANKTWRNIGIGASAVAGGALIGITGGLAAPLVGAGVTTVLAWLGVGGTAAGLLASGLAGSSAVCTALFGAYGARTSARMAGRHLQDVEDFAVLPVPPPASAPISSDYSSVSETLSVRICVSGWLSSQADVTAPWTVCDSRKIDTFALQWEVSALQKLSNALGDLIKSHAMKYVKAEIIRRTVFASLMASLTPVAWLKIGQVIDNPWSNARALAIKTGTLLATLLKERAFGNRPVTLNGYSLGSLVILSALHELSRLPPAETSGIIQDVFLLGTPAPAGDLKMWTRVRRVVAGRLTNAYVGPEEDYVLAVLARLSLSSLTTAAVGADWGVAGLGPVPVSGVENVKIDGIRGHLQWRGMVGRALTICGAEDLDADEVRLQERLVADHMKEMDTGESIDAEEGKRMMNDESHK